MKSLLWRQIWNLSDKIQRPDLFQQCNFYPCELVSILQVYINTISFQFPEFSWFVKILDKSRLWLGTCERIDQYWVELRGGKKNFGLSLKLMMRLHFSTSSSLIKIFLHLYLFVTVFLSVFLHLQLNLKLMMGLHFSTRLPSHHHRPRFNVYVYVFVSVFLFFVSVFALVFFNRISISHQATLCIKLTSTLVNLMFLCTQVNPGLSWPTDAHRNTPINENPEIAFNLIQLQAKLRVMSWSVFELDCPTLMSWHQRAGWSVYIVNQT